MGLDKERRQIDEIDKKLVRLLEERLEVAEAIGRYKKEHGLAILDARREEEILEKNVGRVENKAYEGYLEDILKKLMSVSRTAQSRIVDEGRTSLEDVLPGVRIAPRVADPVVAYGGVPGSYGEEALVRHFGTVREISFRTFDEVVEAVLEGRADYGILPLENTTTGGILEVERLLEAKPVYIVGEEVVPVAHCLLGLGTLEDIRTVYSHPQGFEQSRAFLKGHSFEEVPYFNTAISADFVAASGDKTLGAIASRRAAEVYKLKILAEDINSNRDNYTRFAVIRRDMELDEACDKVSIQVILEDREGTLFQVIRSLTENRLNMVKIASRPLVGKPFEYVFSIDFSGNLKEERVRRTLREIRENSLQMNFKGNYKEKKVMSIGK